MRSPLLAMLLVSVTLAGCTGDDAAADAAGFSVSAPDDPVTEPFVFRAASKADAYAWDLGDGITTAADREVSHVYGFTDGVLRVRLTATVDGEDTVYTRSISLGTGLNQEPEAMMEQSTNWVTPGETLTFSGATTTDADGDDLYFAWTCFRVGDLLMSDGHAHAHGGGDGGVPFASGSAGIREATMATAPLAAAATTTDDICADETGAVTYATDAALTGAFTATGQYTVTMLVKDPKSPAQAFEATVFVSASKPSPTVEESFTGTFQGGNGGSVQNLMEAAGQSGVFDRATHTFSLGIQNLVTAFTLTTDDVVTYTVNRDGSPVVVDQATDVAIEGLGPGNYEVILTLDSGVNVEYTLDVSSTQDLDPLHLYSKA